MQAGLVKALSGLDPVTVIIVVGMVLVAGIVALAIREHHRTKRMGLGLDKAKADQLPGQFEIRPDGHVIIGEPADTTEDPGDDEEEPSGSNVVPLR
jgi:hypothetical protein